MSDDEWAALDWTNLTAKEISQQTGMSVSRVYAYAHKLNVCPKAPDTPTHAGKTVSYTVISWADVDWSLTNAQLSKKLGCSRERVRQKRPKWS